MVREGKIAALRSARKPFGCLPERGLDTNQCLSRKNCAALVTGTVTEYHPWLVLTGSAISVQSARWPRRELCWRINPAKVSGQSTSTPLADGCAVRRGSWEAEKERLSMANPCPLPVGSAINQTSHRAAPGVHSPIAWLVTERPIWLAGAVPSWAPSAPVRKLGPRS